MDDKRSQPLEWDPEERDAWVADAQRWIGQIKGVLQSNIELDPMGDITRIHVVAGFDREPRHIVRDVESLLKARLGIDVYYKKIGVVQVLDNGRDDSLAHDPGTGGGGAPERAETGAVPRPPAASRPGGVTFIPPENESPVEVPAPDGGQPPRDTPPRDTPTHETPPRDAPPRDAPPRDAPPRENRASPPDSEPIPAILVAEDPAPRILCAGVGVLVSEAFVRAEVQLKAGEVSVSGMYEGPNHPHSDVTYTAQATLDAVGKLINGQFLLHLQEITTSALGGSSVVLAAVNLVEGRRSEMLFGVCSAAHNRQQAVVFAVLDALNRRLSQYPLLDSGAEA